MEGNIYWRIGLSDQEVESILKTAREQLERKLGGVRNKRDAARRAIDEFKKYLYANHLQMLCEGILRYEEELIKRVMRDMGALTRERSQPQK